MIAVATSTYPGKTYFFPAAGWEKGFDEDPAKYARTQEARRLAGGS